MGAEAPFSSQPAAFGQRYRRLTDDNVVQCAYIDQRQRLLQLLRDRPGIRCGVSQSPALVFSRAGPAQLPPGVIPASVPEPDDCPPYFQ